MKSSKLPDIWKKSVIIQIYKKGDRTSMYAKYKLDAPTYISCEIMESMILDCMINYLLKHDFLSQCQ